jgi:hypothetical protein
MGPRDGAIARRIAANKIRKAEIYLERHQSSGSSLADDYLELYRRGRKARRLHSSLSSLSLCSIVKESVYYG